MQMNCRTTSFFHAVDSAMEATMKVARGEPND